MASDDLEPGSVIDGFRVEARVHKGGMATLWRVSRPDIDMPLLMKIPKIFEGAEPAAIVSFEMEQMILPRLSGIHVPKFVAAGAFDKQPHVVMEQIPGVTLYKRLGELPLPYDEVAEIGQRIAVAVQDLHRQHVIHHDIKPSNIMFRPSGEAVLLDYGLAFHDQLPDLLHEEFRVPFGTAPYMAPERLRDVRHDPRSDIFSLGVLLYFFATAVRPFGESETMAGMRRRLWRDPYPLRHLKPDCPPWFQEIVLRCLEIEPAWRYATAAQLAFDLGHPSQVKLTQRSERLKRDSFGKVLRRRFNTDLKRSRTAGAVASQLSHGPIVLVAVDLTEGAPALNDELRGIAGRLLATLPAARLACLNVVKINRIALDSALDAEGHNKHVDRLVALKHWAEPLRLIEGEHLTMHVMDAVNPASAILEFARENHVSHILIGARQSSLKRSLLGSVSAEVAADAVCTVTIVRSPAELHTAEALGWSAKTP
jgi:eukaryotic-like serine/threonine-protein kinase